MSAAVERIGTQAAARVARRLAAAMRDELDAGAVTVAGARIEVTGRGLRDAPALRWPGGLLR